MVEPSQTDITHHFMEMAEGKVTDADLAASGHRGMGGRHSRPTNYRMSSVGPVSSVRPVQNVTSDVVASVDQAKSRLGRAIKLDVDLDGDSIPSKHRTGNTSSSSSSSKNKKKKSSSGGQKKKRSGEKRKKSSSSSSKKKRRK